MSDNKPTVVGSITPLDFIPAPDHLAAISKKLDALPGLIETIMVRRVITLDDIAKRWEDHPEWRCKTCGGHGMSPEHPEYDLWHRAAREET